MESGLHQVAPLSTDMPDEQGQRSSQLQQGSQGSNLQLLDLSDEGDSEGCYEVPRSPSKSPLSGSQTPVERPPPFFGDLSASDESTPPSPLLNRRLVGIRSEFSKSTGALYGRSEVESVDTGGVDGGDRGPDKSKAMVRKIRSHAWRNVDFHMGASEEYDIDDKSASVHVTIEPRSLGDLIKGTKASDTANPVSFVRERFEKFGENANVSTNVDEEPTKVPSGDQSKRSVSRPLVRSLSRTDTEPAESLEQCTEASIFHSPAAFESAGNDHVIAERAVRDASNEHGRHILSNHKLEKDDPKQMHTMACCSPKRAVVKNPTGACFMSLLPLLGYLLVGGMFYYFVEGPYELEHAGRWEAHFNATMSEAIALLRSGNITQADFDAIETAVNATVAATKQNKIPQPLDDMNWDLGTGKAFFFVVTVVTTIGYGTIAPTTVIGKLITVFLASVGIATFGYTITIVTERLLSTTRAALEKLSAPHDSCCCPRGIPKCKPSAKAMLVTVAIMNVVIVLCAGLIGVFGYPAWGWGNAVYWAVITFTTVGLGDFYPYFAPDRHPAFKWLGYFGFFLILTLGIALLSALLSALISVFSHQLGGIVGHHKYGAGGMQGMDRHHKIIASPPSPSKHRKKLTTARRSSTTKALSQMSVSKVLPQSHLGRTNSHR